MLGCQALMGGEKLDLVLVAWFLANGSGWAGIGVVGWGRFFTAPPAMGTDGAGGMQMFL